MIKKICLLVALLPLLAAQQNMGPSRHRTIAASGGGTITPKGTPVCNRAYSGSPSVSYTAAQSGDELFIELWSEAGGLASLQYNGSSASAVIPQSSGNSYTGIYEVTGISSGAHNVTWTQTATYGDYCFIEFSGVNSTGNVSTTTSSASPYSVSLTITESGGYVLGMATNNTTSALTPTATSGTIAASSPSAYHGIFDQYNTSSSTGSLPLAGTLSTSQGLQWNLVELKW